MSIKGYAHLGTDGKLPSSESPLPVGNRPAIDGNHTDVWYLDETSGTTFANQVNGRPSLTAASSNDWSPFNGLFKGIGGVLVKNTASQGLRASGLALDFSGGGTVEIFTCMYQGDISTYPSVPFITGCESGYDITSVNNGFYIYGWSGAALRFGAKKSNSYIENSLSPLRFVKHHFMLTFATNGYNYCYIDGVLVGTSGASGSFSANIGTVEIGNFVNIINPNNATVGDVRISNIARDATYALTNYFKYLSI